MPDTDYQSVLFCFDVETENWTSVTGVLMIKDIISLPTCVLKVFVANNKTEHYTMLLILILRVEEKWMNAYNSDSVSMSEVTLIP